MPKLLVRGFLAGRPAEEQRLGDEIREILWRERAQNRTGYRDPVGHRGTENPW
jgi:hypothetical protein